MIKGIAILSMLFYHLFYNQDKLEQLGFGYLAEENPFILILAPACHVCVPLFVFITAYGLSRESTSGKNLTDCLGNSFQRYKKLIAEFAYVFLVLLTVSYIFHLDYNAESVWESLQLQRILGILCNVFGVAGLFKISWFSASWWYMSLAVLLIFFIPLWIAVIRKLGPYASLFLTLFLVPSLSLDTVSDGLPRYLIMVTMGILCSEYNVFEKIETYIGQRKRLRIFFSALLAGSIPLLSVLKPYSDSNYLEDAFMAAAVLLFAVILLKHIPVLREILQYIGKYSMYMWWIHTFFSAYWFSDFIYSFRNIGAIFLVLTVCALASSILLAKAKHIFHCSGINQLYSSGRGLLLLAFITAALCFGITVLSSQMGYLTNDDGSIQNLLNGSVTGEPYITHQFINIMLGAFISFLYKIIPGIQWWYWYSQALSVAGIFLMHFCILKVCKTKQLDIRLPILIIFVLDTGFLIYPVANVSFTIVPAIFGAGLTALLLTMGKFTDIKWRRLSIAAVIIGYVLVLIHRKSSGLAIFCYILLGVLYYLTEKTADKKQLLKKYAGICIFFIVLTAVISGFNSFMTAKINGTDFVQYNSARIRFMDYPKDAYEDNPALYEEAGWSENVYVMARNWGFMDDSITTDSFRYIAENSNASVSMAETLKSFLSDAHCQAILLLWGGCGVAALFFVLRSFDRRLFLLWGANNLGTILLLLYQLINGRMIYRSGIVVLLPAFLINTLILLEQYSLDEKEKPVFQILAAAALLVCGNVAFDYTFDSARNEYMKSAWAKSEAIEEYVIANDDCIYICTAAVYNNINPWRIYTETRPTNLIPWGGSSYHSDSYEKRLALNGIEVLDGRVFERNEVYFLTSENMLEPNVGTVFECFYQHLCDKYGAKGFELADSIGDYAFVYRFVFEEDMGEEGKGV